MRSVIVLTTVLFLGGSTGAGAQAARAATTPEVFSGTAQAKSASSAVSGKLEARVSRYTPDFDCKTVEDALRFGGYPKFLTTLRNAPEVGQLTLADGQPYAIRYAREKVEGAGRTIVLVTDRPSSSSVRRAPTPSRELDTKSPWSRFRWTRQDGAKARWRLRRACAPTVNGGVLLDDYAEALIEVTDVTRRSADQ